jgi:membrane associated rhomboid family serine protease
MVTNASPVTFTTLFTQNIGLPPVHSFSDKFWTILTYGWVHGGFWDLFTNMIWLYAFGSVVQMLVGYRQVVPMFLYALIVGGVFYELAQLLPGGFFAARAYVFGAQAAVVAMAVGALTVAPGYRFHLTPTFSIPLVALVCIFLFLVVISSNLEGPYLFLLGGGALTGYGYIKLLQNGYQPGGWVYGMVDSMNRMATPDEDMPAKQGKKRNQVLNKVKPTRQDSLQKRIDEILDKINQHGYDSLTAEEKEVLLKAGKEDNL